MSTREAVRSYGQMLEKDHSDANKKAAEAAKSMGVMSLSEPNSKQKADYRRMSKVSGSKFDGEFAKHMVADHKKDIREYEKAAKKTDAAASYANETLPTLRKHLDSAQSLSGAGASGSARHHRRCTPLRRHRGSLPCALRLCRTVLRRPCRG
jgi:putative membrane protein